MRASSCRRDPRSPSALRARRAQLALGGLLGLLLGSHRASAQAPTARPAASPATSPTTPPAAASPATPTAASSAASTATAPPTSPGASPGASTATSPVAPAATSPGASPTTAPGAVQGAAPAAPGAGSPAPGASPAASPPDPSKPAAEGLEVASERVPSFSPSRDATRTHFWAQGPTRVFASSAIDVGYLYLRPRISVGYGHPFWTWIGVDANPQVSNNFIGAYAGLRAALPFVDIRVGGRYVFPYRRSYLAPREHFGRLDFENRDLARSTYLSPEAELSGGLPAGPGSLLFVGTYTGYTGVPKGDYVYDENLRLIANTPHSLRGRLGYAVRLGVEGKVSVGLVAEVLQTPGRDITVRSGLIASAVLSNHLEVLGSFVPPIVSPDTLGIAGGDFGTLGLRYRWATGIESEPMVVPAQRSSEEER